MDLSTALQAALLGLLEGLTEFIPVSSTGHLLLAVDLIGFRGPPGKVFEIAIQLGAILAVCWLYRERLFGSLLRLGRDPSAQRFYGNLVSAYCRRWSSGSSPTASSRRSCSPPGWCRWR